MSGPGHASPRLAQLADQHLPADVPLVEFQDWQHAERSAGLAVLPWRGPWLAASAAGVRVSDGVEGLTQTWSAALVHIQKGRAATETDLANAWRALVPGGSLYLLGGNDLGIATVAKRLGEAVGQIPEKIATGGHGRLVRFQRSDHPGPVRPSASTVPADPVDAGLMLEVQPGVFSHDGLDRGTAHLITYLRTLKPAQRVVDVGCGAGHLAIAALRAWPECRAVLLDGDRRAVTSAERNVSALGLSQRASVRWWSDREAITVTGEVDLVLINPPCHAGSNVCLVAAENMLNQAMLALRPGGMLLAVANRQLPYEKTLKRHGSVRVIPAEHGFKLLEVIRG